MKARHAPVHSNIAWSRPNLCVTPGVQFLPRDKGIATSNKDATSTSWPYY